MSWFTKVVHKHTWYVVAFDSGYSTNYTDTKDNQGHQLTFSACDCGCRKIAGNENRPANNHVGVIRAMHSWIENNKLFLSDQGDIYNDDYQCTTMPVVGAVGTYEYLPITGIDKIMKSLKADSDFIQLHNNNQLVQDALAEFETVIKLHEGL
jgi:hypothetical protein